MNEKFLPGVAMILGFKLSWAFLAALGTVLFAAMWILLKPREEQRPRILKMALFLLALDFAFENFGALTGLWVSRQSVFYVAFVPIEVLYLAFISGAAYAMLFPPKFNTRVSVGSSLAFAAIGVVIEAMQIQSGLLEYAYHWAPYLAFPVYASVFVLVAYANGKL